MRPDHSRHHVSGSSCCGGHGKAGAVTAEAVKARDPVCGMFVAGPLFVLHGDTRYHFCSERCRQKFLADPARQEELRNQAAVRARQFTWDRAAGLAEQCFAHAVSK